MNFIAKLLNTDQTVFTIEDIAFLTKVRNSDSLNSSLFYYLKKRELIRLRRGLFYLRDREPDKFELANKYISPSYISLDTARQKYGMNFQYDESIHVISKKSGRYLVKGISIISVKAKKNILFNPDGLVNEKNYTIASPERALLDTIYLNGEFAFDKIDTIDFEKAEKLAGIYGKKIIKTRLREIIETYE